MLCLSARPSRPAPARSAACDGASQKLGWSSAADACRRRRRLGGRPGASGSGDRGDQAVQQPAPRTGALQQEQPARLFSILHPETLVHTPGEPLLPRMPCMQRMECARPLPAVLKQTPPCLPLTAVRHGMGGSSSHRWHDRCAAVPGTVWRGQASLRGQWHRPRLNLLFLPHSQPRFSGGGRARAPGVYCSVRVHCLVHRPDWRLGVQHR